MFCLKSNFSTKSKLRAIKEIKIRTMLKVVNVLVKYSDCDYYRRERKKVKNQQRKKQRQRRKKRRRRKRRVGGKLSMIQYICFHSITTEV